MKIDMKRKKPWWWKWLQVLLVAGLGITGIILAFQHFNPSEPEPKSPDTTITYASFMEKAHVKTLINITILSGELHGLSSDGTTHFRCRFDPDLVKPTEEFSKWGLEFNFLGFDEVLPGHEVPQKPTNWVTVTKTTFAIVLIIAVTGYCIWRFPFKKNRFWTSEAKAKTYQKNAIQVTFRDVAGVDEAKAELREFIDFLKDPAKFRAVGAKMPKGALLIGPPGNGKTLIARAIAGEAGVPFKSMGGSRFVEMYVGVGASRVRKLCEEAKAEAPCIIFIDEVDALGARSGGNGSGGDREYEQTINALLEEMDGFEENSGVIFLAATNNPQKLDEALLRPGRFTRQVTVRVSGPKGRKEVLEVHTRKVPLGKDVDLDHIARATPGFSGADLANLINEAALWAGRHYRKEVTMADFEYAKDKVILGVEMKSVILTSEERRTIAYHEAGHAIIAFHKPGVDKPHKITISARGNTLGASWTVPAEERRLLPKEHYLTELVMLYGGRIAEEKFMRTCTPGAQNDIERATDIAENIVCAWGMSKLGPINFMGRAVTSLGGRRTVEPHTRNFAEETQRKIDGEITKLVENACAEARDIIEKNAEVVEAMASALLEYEVLDADQLQQLVDGKSLPEKTKTAPASSEPVEQ